MKRPEIISADDHLVEPPNIWMGEWPKYLAGRGYELVPGAPIIPVGLSGSAGRRVDPNAGWDVYQEGALNPAKRLEAMDRDGVKASYLYPTFALQACAYVKRHAKLVEWIANDYNAYAFDFSQYARSRLRPLALYLPRQEPKYQHRDMLEGHLRWAAGIVLPELAPEGEWSDAGYDPLWTVIADLGIPACFHTFSGPVYPHRAGPIGTGLHAYRSAQDLLAVLLLGGVLTRHPTLRITLAEADDWWVWGWWNRLRAYVSRYPHVAGGELPRRIGDRVAVTTWSPRAWALGHVLFGADFPHADSSYPGTVAAYASSSWSKTEQWYGRA